jgi:hypothetical protein
MTPRGDRLACTLRTLDRCQGTFSVFAGDQPGTVGIIEPVAWDQPPKREVLEAVFTLFQDLGMTGRIIMLNQYQWRALAQAKLEAFFFAAIIWGKNPYKVVEDAETITRRDTPVRAAITPSTGIAARQG